MGVNSNPVVDPNKQSLIAEDLAAPFAQHRDEVAEREAAELVEAKKAAYEELQVSGINPEQNKVFKQQIDDAADIATVESLRKTIGVVADNPVEPFVPSRPEESKPPVDESESDDEQQPSSPLLEQALRTAKEKAWDYVAGSEGLTAEDKQRFQGEITAAADLQAVEDIHAEVLNVEEQNLLADARGAAVAAVEGSQYLSDAQKAAYKGALEAATTTRQIDGLVNAALDSADLQQESVEAGAHRALLDNELGVNSNPVVDPNKQSLIAEDLAAPFAQHRDEVAKQEAAEKLAASKTAAAAEVEGAVHLTENQKSEFKGRINASASVANVAAVVDEAHKLADKQATEEADKGELADEKVQAHRIIDGLDKLSPEQKVAFKKQVDDANTGAYVAHVVERAQEMNAQQHPSGDGTGAQEPGKPGNNETPGKPGSDNKPGKDQKPGSTTDAFKGFFGLAAGMGVFALIFGGIMHTINHFDGFGVIQEHVRNAFAKIGIRF